MNLQLANCQRVRELPVPNMLKPIPKSAVLSITFLFHFFDFELITTLVQAYAIPNNPDATSPKTGTSSGNYALIINLGLAAYSPKPSNP